MTGKRATRTSIGLAVALSWAARPLSARAEKDASAPGSKRLELYWIFADVPKVPSSSERIRRQGGDIAAWPEK
jgi:hypothetical protein